MLENELYTNKNGKKSKFKEFCGIWNTAFIDWITLIFSYTAPFVALCMFIFGKNVSHYKAITVGLIVFAVIMLIANIFETFFVEQYVYNRNVEARKPDRIGLMYCLFGLNVPMFFMLWNKLPKDKRWNISFITKPIKNKQVKTKHTSVFKKNKKNGVK